MPDDVPNRRTFTIHCHPTGGIEIKDGNNKPGGNVRTASREKLAWINVTSQATCYLSFRIVSRGDDDGRETWPFEEASDGGLLALPRASRTARTLLTVGATRCVEYQVLDGRKQPLLDPIIIIDPN